VCVCKEFYGSCFQGETLQMFKVKGQGHSIT